MLSPELAWKGLQNAEGIEGHQLNLPCYPSANRITAYVLHFCCWSHIFLTAHVSYRLLKEKIPGKLNVERMYVSMSAPKAIQILHLLFSY